MTCAYCTAKPVACSTIQDGEKPANPKHHATKMDSRRIVIVRVCEEHLGKLGVV